MNSLVLKTRFLSEFFYSNYLQFYQLRLGKTRLERIYKLLFIVKLYDID